MCEGVVLIIAFVIMFGSCCASVNGFASRLPAALLVEATGAAINQRCVDPSTDLHIASGNLR